jgi:uncharacterized protein with HEPN domain
MTQKDDRVYIRHMIDNSHKAINFVKDISREENQIKEERLNDFRISWQEAMNGETIPVEQLWEY